jgi:integrase
LVVYEAEAPFLRRGEEPPPTASRGAINLRDLVNLFLTAKEADADAGTITRGSFKTYLPTSRRLLEHFGPRAKPGEISKTQWAAYRLKLLKHFAPPSASVEVAKVKCIFHWAVEFDHLEKVTFGKAFARAPKTSLLKHQNAGGRKCYAAEEIDRILAASDLQLRAIVLLALNAAYGNADVASLPETALDLNHGWVEFPRVKTGVARRCPLWPEVVEILREWLPRRPKPGKEAVGLVFLSSRGNRWIRNEGRTDALGARFSRLLKKLEINGRRSLGLYTMRHTFATAGANSRDTDAVRAILGHIDPHTSAAYIEGISDERLLAVTETVRQWLWPETAGGAGEGGDA